MVLRRLLWGKLHDERSLYEIQICEFLPSKNRRINRVKKSILDYGKGLDEFLGQVVDVDDLAFENGLKCLCWILAHMSNIRTEQGS